MSIDCKRTARPLGCDHTSQGGTALHSELYIIVQALQMHIRSTPPIAANLPSTTMLMNHLSRIGPC